MRSADFYKSRNAQIKADYAAGKPIGDLAIEHRVTRDRIRRIVRGWVR